MSGAQTGISFTTLTIDTPVYLNYLLSRFLARGGKIVRGAVQHLSQIIEGGAHVFSPGHARKTDIDALVVCPGLGARTLGGVEDKDVYPVRGQVVLLRAPWIKFGRTASHLPSSLWTYIIPRRSGDVSVSLQASISMRSSCWPRSSSEGPRLIMIGKVPVIPLQRNMTQMYYTGILLRDLRQPPTF